MPAQKLSQEGRKILEHPEYQKRKAANKLFTETLREYVATEEGFDDPLKSVTNMMRLEAGDDARIYTWQMPDSTYSYVKFGLVAARHDDKIRVTELKSKGRAIPEAEFRRLKPDDWYGAIYYEVIPIEKDGKELYTLLGFSPGSDLNQKIIDVLEIDARGKPRFGAKVFKIDEFMDKTLRKPPMRLILSYSGDYAASVRWNEDEKMIVMDHLAPPDAKMKGVYRMYGPDMSYDALEWEDDWWNLIRDVEIKSNQNVPIVPPDRPTDLPPSR